MKRASEHPTKSKPKSCTPLHFSQIYLSPLGKIFLKRAVKKDSLHEQKMQIYDDPFFDLTHVFSFYIRHMVN